MAIITRRFPRLAMATALAAMPILAGGANARPDHHVAPHSKRHPHHVRDHAGVQPSNDANAAGIGTEGGRTRTPAGGGDTSGFPGGNEFNPSAPFGGQAAVTAPVGTDAYKEQMIQRRDFCEYASNRC